MTATRFRNWAGNIEYRASGYATPSSIDELQDVVAAAPSVKAAGTGHSFNRIADTTGLLVRTERLPYFLDVDARARTATVPSGARYAQVAADLENAGWALHNLGSLPHISVGGACATGTHGAGSRSPNLASAARAIEYVRADGELETVVAGDRDFPGAVLALGALGIATKLTLAVEPSFTVRQTVYLDLPIATAAAHADELLNAAYSVSAFSNFAHPGLFNTVWLKRRVDEDDAPFGPTFLGAPAADAPQHPTPGLDAAAATPQLGSVGPWHSRLPHFRAEYTPSSGDELQSEFFVPRAAAGELLGTLEQLAPTIAPVLQVFELRPIAADEMWLSPCYQQDSVGAHFTWAPAPEAVRPVVEAVQRALAPLAPRPHWAKVSVGFTADDAEQLYPQLPAFRRFAARLDPDGKFHNEFLRERLLGT